jgi:hypothetical protein
MAALPHELSESACLTGRCRGTVPPAYSAADAAALPYCPLRNDLPDEAGDRPRFAVGVGHAPEPLTMMENVHFRTTFDVEAQSESLHFGDLVWEITGWIRSKEGPAAHLTAPWLLQEGTWRKPDGRASVEVDSVGGASGAPTAWALRYSHHDAEFAARRWTIDITLIPVDVRRWRLAMTVGNSLHSSFMGKEPGRLPVTPPRIVKNLVGSDRWKCWSGNVRLTTVPTTIDVGKANVLRDLMEFHGRGCALTYVSRDRTTGETLIDPARLATSVLGSGLVFVAGSPDLDEELEYLIPFEFRAPNGMVRVYAPGTNLDDVRQSFRHRFFTKQQIEAAGAQEIEQQIARSLTARSGWLRVQSTFTSIDDVRAAHREVRRAELIGRNTAESQRELIELYEQTNRELTDRLETRTKERDEAQERADDAELQTEEFRDRLRATEYERDTFRADAVDAKRRSASLETAVATARGISELPATLTDVVELIQKLHGDRIVFAERAIEAARSAAINDAPDGVHIAWRHLHAAATVLPKLAFDEGVSAGALPARFREASGGLELSMTEGKTTKADAKLVDARAITVDGRTWDGVAHIKFGAKVPRLLRIHFALDRDRQRVIVGHCGDHLDTAGTRRRG